MDLHVFNYKLPPENEPHFYTKVISQEAIFVGRSVLHVTEKEAFYFAYRGLG
jgi:hypothetical protein